VLDRARHSRAAAAVASRCCPLRPHSTTPMRHRHPREDPWEESSVSALVLVSWNAVIIVRY